MQLQRSVLQLPVLSAFALLEVRLARLQHEQVAQMLNVAKLVLQCLMAVQNLPYDSASAMKQRDVDAFAAAVPENAHFLQRLDEHRSDVGTPLQIQEKPPHSGCELVLDKWLLPASWHVAWHRLLQELL